MLDLATRLEQLDRALNAARGVTEVVNDATDVVARTVKLARKILPAPTAMEFEQHVSGTEVVPVNERRREQYDFVSSSFELAAAGVRLAGQSNTQHVISQLLGAHASLAPMMLLNTLVGAVDGYLTRRVVVEGFSGLAATLNANFAELGVRFDWGIAELKWRLGQLSATADQIRDILTRPLETEVRELRAQGIESYNQGWYDDALFFFLKAMAKARVDYVIAQYVGNIYLFHKREARAAAQWYGKAAKYSRPYSVAHHVTASIYEALALSLAPGEQKLEDFRAAATCIERAIEVAENEAELFYQLAHYSVLMDDADKLRTAAIRTLRLDPRYVVKFLLEPDFHEMRDIIGDAETVVCVERRTEVAKSIADHASIIADIKQGVFVHLGFYHGWPIASEIPDKHKVMRERHVYYRHPYEDDPRMMAYVQRLEEAAALYAQDDLLSVVAAGKLLALLRPVRSKGTINWRDYYPRNNSWTSKTEHYTYWGIGSELL